MATSGASRGPGPERAFVPELPASGVLRLDADEGHHLVRVRRLRVGDAVVLFDGRGGSVLGRLVDASASAPAVELVGPYPDREPGREVVVASSVPGPSRLDDLVTGLAELGVAEWIPLRCARSDPAGAALVGRREARFVRLVREAAKVSGRSRLLRIGGPVDFDAGLVAAPGGKGFLLDPDPAAGRLSDAIRALPSPGTAVRLFVGPEGGFTDDEVRRARAAGVDGATVSALALRTEVAAVVGAALALEG